MTAELEFIVSAIRFPGGADGVSWANNIYILFVRNFVNAQTLIGLA